MRRLATIRRNLAKHELIYECARCERVSYGDGQWIELRGQRFDREEVTRVVCPGCLAVYLPPAS